MSRYAGFDDPSYRLSDWRRDEARPNTLVADEVPPELPKKKRRALVRWFEKLFARRKDR